MHKRVSIPRAGRGESQTITHMCTCVPHLSRGMTRPYISLAWESKDSRRPFHPVLRYASHRLHLRREYATTHASFWSKNRLLSLQCTCKPGQLARVSLQHARASLQHSRARLQYARVGLQQARVGLEHALVKLALSTCKLAT